MRRAVVRQQRRHPANARGLGFRPDVPDPGEEPRGVRGGNRLGGVETDALGCTGDLGVRGDVLALAEERLVERVLEWSRPAGML